MAKILFLIPGNIITPEAQEALSCDYPDVKVILCKPNEAVNTVQQFLPEGVNIIGARTVTATILKQTALPVTVVTIPITSFDIIRAIDEAKVQGKRIAVIAPAMMVLGINYIADILGVNIHQYAVGPNQDYERPIQEAIKDGTEVILGGALAAEAAKIHSLPFSLLKIGAESILQAAQEAVQIQKALEANSARSVLLSTILNYTNYGIITVNEDFTITAFNPTAQKLTKINKSSVLGEQIDKVLPQIKFARKRSEETTDHVININGNRMLCDSVPIVFNHKSYGAVVTLQEINKIQQMEAVIRKEIYARGHIARFHFEDVIGKSPSILATIETAKQFAKTNSSILILGETGTGKEIFAQSIHNASKRSQKPFVAINCASLPIHLLESELFGYAPGAFTGASKEGKPGLFEVAHGGTIFLDELAEMDYTNQGRLLRVLQEKTVVRLGSYRVIPIDVRVIAATNKNLDELVSENKFRDDLFYRLDVLRLELPPLRERKEDIHLFAQMFFQQFTSELGRSLSLSQDALQLLENWSWPGNIRECQNLMERVAATAKTERIDSTQIMEFIKSERHKEFPRSPKQERLVREIMAALAECKGNQTMAAKILGINRATLYRRMLRLNIEY